MESNREQEQEVEVNTNDINKMRTQLEKSYWKQFEGVKLFYLILGICGFLGLVAGAYFFSSYMVGRNANKQQELPTIERGAELGTPGRIRTRVQRQL